MTRRGCPLASRLPIERADSADSILRAEKEASNQGMGITLEKQIPSSEPDSRQAQPHRHTDGSLWRGEHGLPQRDPAGGVGQRDLSRRRDEAVPAARDAQRYAVAIRPRTTMSRLRWYGGGYVIVGTTAPKEPHSRLGEARVDA